MGESSVATRTGILLEVAAVARPHGASEQHRAGRAAAAAALRRGGCPVTEVGRRADGAPVFPCGFAGTITHTARFAVAAVARGTAGIGVDLETADVDPRISRVILDDTERALLWPDHDPATLRWLFAAKEAAFKALSDCREAHGGIFWRVRLRSVDRRLAGSTTISPLWGHAGHHTALVKGGMTDRFAFALATRQHEKSMTVTSHA